MKKLFRFFSSIPHFTFLNLSLLFVLINFAIAQIPQTISYQGVLTDASGVVVPDGNYTLTFKLYEVSSGGSAIWTETQSVTVSKGMFNVILGSVNPLTMDFDKPYWLGMAVAPHPELSPRTPLTSAAYSLNTAGGAGNISEVIAGAGLSGGGTSGAVTLDVGEGTGINLSDNEVHLDTIFTNSRYVKEDQVNSVSSAMIQDGAVQTADLAAGAVTTSEILDGTIQTTDLSFTPAIRPLSPGVSTAEIANNAVTSAKIQDEQVAASDLANNAVTTSKIANNAVIAAKISPNVVSSLDGVTNDAGDIDLVEGANITITPDDGANTITIAASGGGGGDITAVNAGTGLSGGGTSGDVTLDLDITYTDGRYVEEGQANAVTSGMIQDGQVGSSDLGNNAVTTAKLTDNAVTAAKISPNVVSSLDGVTNDAGNIDLVEGANITITPNDAANTITIAASGGIGGSGTANYLPRFTGSTTIGNSEIHQSATNRIGIGTTIPAEKLDINGTARMTGFKMSPGANNGYVLTSNASGVGTWKALSAPNAWNLTGNSGTTPGPNFLGTTDNQALELKVNSQRAFRLEPTTSSPNIIGGISNNSVVGGLVGATICGGGLSYGINQVSGNFGTIGGGNANTAASNATVGGGSDNEATGNHSTIGGGAYNIASGNSASIGGGSDNSAGTLAAVAGGSQNNANNLAFVGGGSENSANGQLSVVAGGDQNTANGQTSAIGGGYSNYAPGPYAAIPGGYNNNAEGDYSFAAGRRAKAIHAGSFVWGDATNADFGSTANNQFLIRASGGVGIRTDTPIGDLHVDGHYRYAGYFISDSASYLTDVIHAEFTATGNFDGNGVYGKSTPAPYYGFGGYFEGGWVGVRAYATEAGTGSRYGVNSSASGGDGAIYGVRGSASGGSTTYGVYGYGSGGSSNNYGVYASGNLAYTGSLIHVSDAKFKENFQPLTGALAKIKQLNPQTFTFTDNPQYAHLSFADGRHYGLTAQEVEAVLPELVSNNIHPSAAEARGEKSNDSPVTYKGLNYMEMIPLLIRAIQEQQQEIEELKSQIKALSEEK